MIAAALIAVAALIATLGVRRCRSAAEHRAATATGSSAGSTGIARTAADRGEADARLPAWFAGAGAPERRIAGTVIFDGRPFAGAAVTLHAIVARTAVGAPVAQTSDADGRFDFGAQPAGWFDVVASAPGKLAAVAHVVLADPAAKPPPDQLVLRLSACETWVAGTVRDPAGGPIARAQIRRDGVAGTDADDQGRYELCVPPGPLALEYSADGYGAVVLAVTAELRTRRDVVLVPEAIVQGVVLDEAARPVAGAFVAVNPTEWGPERPATRNALADADGRFRIARLVPGRARLWGYPAGLVTEPGGQEVLADVGTSIDVVLRLVARPTVRGRVLRAGVPVEGAEVVAIRKSPPARSWSAYSQADGTFVLTHVPPGDLAIAAAPYRVTAPQEIRVARAPVTGVVVEVEAMAAIRGRVTHRGVPVEGAQVCCVARPNGDRVTSGADGAYAFEGVEPGTYQLMASSDRVGAFVEPVAVTVEAAEERRLDLEMPHAAVITGTVVDERGAPLPGLRVRFLQPSGDLCFATSDEGGRYRCTSMTGGAVYRASVFANVASTTPLPTPRGSPYPAIELRDGASTIDGVTIAVLHRKSTIRGRVVDTSGEPVLDARVRANTLEHFASWLQLPSAITDGDGAFEIDELANDTYAVQARTSDGATGTALGVPAGGAPITITLARPGAIAGTLVGFPAPPVIYAVPVATGSSHTGGTVTGGTYRISGLKPGRYLVNAQTTFEGDARDVEVRAGETATLDLAAKGRGTIEATVLDFETKAPVPNVVCHVVLAVNGTQGLTNWDPAVAPRSDAAGRLRLDPAPAGDTIVGCLATNPRTSTPSAEVTVVAGATTRVALWSVASKVDNWPWTGLGFDWRVVPPRIALIEPRGPAAEAGLALGDLVTAVGERSVAGLDGDAVRYLIHNYPIGTRVPITVRRAGQPVQVVLELRPPP